MSSKASAVLDKVQSDRRRSKYDKALSRLDDGIKKFPKEISLYTEGIDLAMEAGESLKALQYIKTAQQRMPDRRFEIWSIAAEKTGTYNDPIIGKFLIEHSIREDDLTAASSIANNLKDHTADELLRRVRTKRQTLSTAFGGGMTVGDDITHNAICEGLLCIRLSHFSDAMKGFLGILDQNQAAHRRIEPFFAGLEREHRHNGELSFVLGCCYLASGQFGKAMEKITRAVELDPSLTDPAIERVESLEDDAGLPADERQLFLARLLIGKGQDSRVTRLLKQVLEQGPNRALEVLELLEPHVINLTDNIDLHFVFVDAALLLGRHNTVTSMLRKIYQAKKHRATLVAWLDERRRERSIPVEVLTFSGETALKEAMYGKAIEIFKEILSYGPQEEPTIKELLSRHRSNSLVGHFFKERFNESVFQARSARPEFETYDRPEFSRSETPKKTEEEKSSPDASRQSGRRPDLSSGEFRLGKNESSEDLGLDNHDFSLGSGGSARAEVDEEEHPVVENSPAESFADESFAGLMAKDSTSDESFAEPTAKDSTSDESFAEPTAKDSTSDESFAEPTAKDSIADEFPTEPTVDRPAARPAPGDSPAGSEVKNDGDSDLFSYLQRDIPDEPSFLEGDDADESPFGDDSPDSFPALSNEAAGDFLDSPNEFQGDYPGSYDDDEPEPETPLELAERALNEGALDEAKELLGFDPANLAEEIRRKYLLAVYYLACERPIQALVILRSVQLIGLSRDETKDFLFRIAECYQQLQNFEAANSVFMRIIADYPDAEVVEHTARVNYERYLRRICGEEPVLEKITSL